MIVNILQVLGIYICLVISTITLAIVLNTMQKEDKDA
jgi:hypothetical protein